MDNKITKTRLKTFFTYDLIKVLAIMLVLCVACTIVFNAISEKPTSAQTFYVLCDPEIVIGEEGDMLPIETARKGVENGGFSYDILEVSTKSVQVAGAYNASYMLNTSVELGDDDIFITGKTLGKEYMEKYAAADIVGLVKNAKKYCIDQGFYTESGEINEEKIKEYFVKTRTKYNRFKFGRNQEQGKALEIKRIKTIWENASVLEKVFNEHSEIFPSEFTSFTWGERVITGNFAIDLSALKGGDSKNDLTNAFKFALYNEETGEVTYTSNGLYLMVGSNQEFNGDLDYESLAYIRTIIEKYSNFI